MTIVIPKVSVVISTFNRSHYLARAIRSVLDQSFQEFELIIVDDASTDQTKRIVSQLNDPRVRYIGHEQNRGGPAARNTGIRNAKGALIALLDDDDEWYREKLQKQVAKMESLPLKVGLVYVGSEIYSEGKRRVDSVNTPAFSGNVYKRLLLSTILGSCSSVLIRRECFEKAGMFDEELSSCQDWDMWMRIAKQFEFDFVPETLTRISAHGEQISTNYAALIPGRTRMVQKHWDEFKVYPEILVIHLKRLGKLHCLNGTWSQAPGWFARAIAIRPIEIVKVIAWCLVELPFLKLFSNTRNFKKHTR